MPTENNPGTSPLWTIELSFDEPIPNGCMCKWDFYPKRRIKAIKVLSHGCVVRSHVIAFNTAHDYVPANVVKIGPKIQKKRGDRGKDKAPRERRDVVLTDA